MDKDELKEKAKDALKVVAAETDEKYDDLLEKIAEDHKPSVGRSRIFVAGAIAGAVVVQVLHWIF